jgi:type I site-specific restriction endonuclease
MHLQTQLKSLALVPMTPIRTSSLRHNMVQETSSRTPRSAKENMHPRSRSASPRKPLKEVTNGIQPTDLIKEDTDEFIEHSKRMFRNIQIENNSLRNKVEELQEAKLEMEKAKLESVDQLQVELERLSQENHRLEKLLQDAQNETTQIIMSPRPTPKEKHTDEEIARLKDELNWHAKLMSYAEKERMRLLDLLDFSGKEGKFVVKEYVGLREKMSKVSLKSEGSSCKCLI